MRAGRSGWYLWKEAKSIIASAALLSTPGTAHIVVGQEKKDPHQLHGLVVPKFMLATSAALLQ